MRQYIPAIVAGLIAGSLPGGYAVWHKPAPTIIQPQTTIVSRGPALPMKGAPGVSVTMGGVPIISDGDAQKLTLTRSEQRQLAASWGELDQKEIDVLSDLLKRIPSFPLTIFCIEDSRCGDLQLDFDNAFETAHWDTKLEKPFTDDTVGVVTSSPALRDAIDEATSKRFNVGIIPKNGPRDFLVIGSKK